MPASSRAAVTLVLLVGASGCYHFTFEQEPARTRLTAAATVEERARETVTYSETVPTYLNGFVGNGKIATWKYCADPVRTELRVTGKDVALSLVTLLVYTPHTLYVTCEKEEGGTK